ncbi:MAG: Rrf2 family transcriptional regulator [Planctomycetota bacterium]|nr:MAG: Rrf2 family transcriptional regulator [Planctomycetota bacterium]
MFKLNKSTRFAIYAMVELASVEGKSLPAAAIAEKYNISEHHVAKVLQQLAKNGLVESIRGVGGGFRILTDPKEVTLWDLVKIFEPLSERQNCAFQEGQECCRLHACNIHQVLQEIEDQIYYTLKSVTIGTLCFPKRIFEA